MDAGAECSCCNGQIKFLRPSLHEQLLMFTLGAFGKGRSLRPHDTCWRQRGKSIARQRAEFVKRVVSGELCGNAALDAAQ